MLEAILAKTLITGADGAVGSYVDFGIKTNKHLLDVTYLKEVLTVCKKFRPAIILHLAAETDVDRCQRDPQHAYLVNSIGTYNMALVAKELRAKLIYISTAGVFDGNKNSAYVEEDEPKPPNYYGHSKFLGELAVRGMLKNYLIVRVCWVMGGGPDKDQKFVAKIINQLKNPKIEEVKAITDQVGSPTFAKDLIAAIKILISENKNGLFHLANTGIVSRYDVAKFIVDVLRPEVTVSPVDSSYFNLDAQRTKNEGLISKVNLMRPWQKALEEYLETEWKPILKI